MCILNGVNAPQTETEYVLWAISTYRRILTSDIMGTFKQIV